MGRVTRSAGEIVSYPPPASLLGQSPVAECIEGRPRYRPAGPHFGPEKTLFALDDAGVATDEGIVYCPRQRAAVAETVRSWTTPTWRHSLFTAPRFPKATPLLGRTFSLLTLGGTGFYHFLVEALPRLRLIEGLRGEVDNFLVNGRPGGFQESWLVAAGVPRERLIWATPLMHFRCEELLFTSPVVDDCRPDNWLREALRTLLPVGRPCHDGRLLWVSRSDASARHLTWEDELLRHLPSFDKIVLSDMTAAQQIALFGEAKVVAGPHGAGFANLLFAGAGIRLVELFPNDRFVPLFSRCAHVAGGTASWAAVDFSSANEIDRLAAAIGAFSQQTDRPQIEVLAQ